MSTDQDTFLFKCLREKVAFLWVGGRARPIEYSRTWYGFLLRFTSWHVMVIEVPSELGLETVHPSATHELWFSSQICIPLITHWIPKHCFRFWILQLLYEPSSGGACPTRDWHDTTKLAPPSLPCPLPPSPTQSRQLLCHETTDKGQPCNQKVRNTHMEVTNTLYFECRARCHV